MDSQHTCAGICAWLIAGLLCLGGVGPAYAETFAGPVEARVISVLDGDTFLAEARVWPGHTVRVNIRIRGIDAPEKRARCTAERAAAQAAREALHALIGEGPVRLSNIASAKYFGRVLADVETIGGLQLAKGMLAAELVRPYRGGRRESWC
jgi:micrococcal nuclease